jgi:hypothetical protein
LLIDTLDGNHQPQSVASLPLILSPDCTLIERPWKEHQDRPRGSAWLPDLHKIMKISIFSVNGYHYPIRLARSGFPAMD